MYNLVSYLKLSSSTLSLIKLPSFSAFKYHGRALFILSRKNSDAGDPFLDCLYALDLEFLLRLVLHEISLMWGKGSQRTSWAG
jgi:hypothetical protein